MRQPANILHLLKTLIRQEGVSTQEEICHRLQQLGHDINQTKVSRLLRKIGAVKTKNEDGVIVYHLPKEPPPPTLDSPLIDLIVFSKKRKQSGNAAGWLVEYSRAFFPVLLAVLLIRSFLVQGFRVPTGSLKPTVLPGDLIAVNQYAYGLRLPVIHKKFYSVGEPKRGEIAVFRYPPDPNQTYVKRVVGVPGDKIAYKNKILYVNGKEIPQSGNGMVVDHENGNFVMVEKRLEKLNGVIHSIYLRPNRYARDFEREVPPGYYFMMGDNRDNSADSRDWGFVPEENLIGKAFGIWMSWDSNQHRVRFERIGIGL